MIRDPVRVRKREGLEPERSGEPQPDLLRVVRLGADGCECAVELLGASGQRERLERMHAEATHVRVECGEGGGTADVGDPRSGRDRGRDVGDCPVRHAEQHELGTILGQVDLPLAQPRGDRRPDASRADYVCSLDHVVGSSSVAGYRAKVV